MATKLNPTPASTPEKMSLEDVKKTVALSTSVVTQGGDDFENPNVGEQFGGSFARMDLKENEVSPLYKYVKDTRVVLEKELDDGTKITEIKNAPVVSLADAPDAPLISLPIGTIFEKHWKESNINPGDTFKVKRYLDVMKKRGKGAGSTKMKVFALKVYSRVPVAKTA